VECALRPLPPFSGGVHQAATTDTVHEGADGSRPANDAALELYRRAWKPDQSFEVRSKYLTLADKSARTLAVLSDALDRHRGRNVQPIKNVTVTGGAQAVVADTIIAGRSHSE
jgi:hypothetical protein